MRGEENLTEYIDVTSGDIKNLEKIRATIGEREDAVFDRFYKYKLSFPEFRRFFVDDEHIELVMRKQREHFHSLLSGRLDAEYFRSSRRIGEVHYRIGLRLEQYMAAYYRFVESVLGVMPENIGFSVVLSFLKLAFVDMISTSRSYIDHWEEAIRSVDELKANVLANISHEILTPVTMIKGFSEIALESEDLEEIREYIRRIRRETLRLEEITSNLVEAARGRVDITREEVNLRELIQEVVAELMEFFTGADVEIIQELKAEKVYTDRYKLKMILRNIIHNAIKFNKSNGKVWIRSYPLGSRTVIEVEDTGIGIPPDRIQDIFKPLTQLHPETSRAYSGTGMGLYVVKKYVDALKGRIEVESSPEKGTLMRVIL